MDYSNLYRGVMMLPVVDGDAQASHGSSLVSLRELKVPELC